MVAWVFRTYFSQLWQLLTSISLRICDYHRRPLDPRVRPGDCSIQVEAETDNRPLSEGSKEDVRGTVCLAWKHNLFTPSWPSSHHLDHLDHLQKIGCLDVTVPGTSTSNFLRPTCFFSTIIQVTQSDYIHSVYNKLQYNKVTYNASNTPVTISDMAPRVLIPDFCLPDCHRHCSNRAAFFSCWLLFILLFICIQRQPHVFVLEICHDFVKQIFWWMIIGKASGGIMGDKLIEVDFYFWCIDIMLLE